MKFFGSNLVVVVLSVVFSVLHHLVVVLDRYFLIVSLLAKVVKDFISYPVTKSIMIVPVEKERILIISVWVSISKQVANSVSQLRLSLFVFVLQSNFFSLPHNSALFSLKNTLAHELSHSVIKVFGEVFLESEYSISENDTR